MIRGRLAGATRQALRAFSSAQLGVIQQAAATSGLLRGCDQPSKPWRSPASPHRHTAFTAVFDAAGYATTTSGSGPEDDEPADAAAASGVDDEDFGQEEYEAAMQQYAAEVAGDEEYEGAQSLLASSLEEQQRLLQQQQRAEQQRQDSPLPPADSLSRTKAQNLLKQIVDGKLDGVLPEVSAGSPEEDRMEADMAAYMDTFKMQVVDVNRSNKGTRSGGIATFSAMVVVGNFTGVLGLGVGKSAELADAVKKAFAQAMKNLFYVPRYRGHTIIHPVSAKYGRVVVKAWPLASSGGRGRGVRAGRLMESVCRLAGLENIGVKVHGSRCARNAVKALLTALEGQQTLAQMQRSLGGARVRELAPGMRRKRRPGDRLKDVKGEWYRESQPLRPGMQRLPLPTPIDPSVYKDLPPPDMFMNF